MGVAPGRAALSWLPTSMQDRSDSSLPQRRRALGALAMTALGLHLLVLGDLNWIWPGVVAEPPAALRVRLVGSRSAVQPSAVSTAARVEPEPHPPAPAKAAPKPPPSLAQPATAMLATQAVRSEEVPSAFAPVDAAEPVMKPVAAPAAPLEETPLYRTAIPPSTTLRFAFRRGSQEGFADLRWEADGSGYRLGFEARIGDAVVFRQQSQGSFDAAGLAPLRYTDRRARREVATNFQREAGLVSFSAASGSHPLQAGSQDRLSWMLQLVAVLAGEPQRLAPGQLVSLIVAGPRGAPVAWTFLSSGTDRDAGVPGSPSTVRLVREGEGPYDTRVEVWVDPERGHLPVRVRFTAATEARSTEMRLLAAEP